MQHIGDFYRGKTVLLTGGTGLLGKVLLERMLSHFPDLTRIHVLIRGKNRPGSTAMSSLERLRREVQDSEVFGPLKKRIGSSFETFFEEKVQAVPGDMSQEKLGLDHETYLKLQQEVHQ